MVTSIRCTCCQAELTAPQFYDGRPYGWTCIKKIDPQFKRTKTVFVAVEAYKQVSDENTTRLVVNVKYNGKWIQIVSYGSNSVEQRTMTTYMQDGVLFIADHLVK